MRLTVRRVLGALATYPNRDELRVEYPELEDEDPTLADKIVVTSWTHMLRCTSFDEAALDDMSDNYRGPQGDGPEKFELDQLQQGAN